MRLLAVIFLLAYSALPHNLMAGETSAFGTSKNGGAAALMGIFYDLTQTQDGKDTGVTTSNYQEVLINYLKDGWNEDDLNRFYRASKPLYATQIWLPTMPTTAAPKAFGVEQRAPRAVWIIHYKGQVVAPHDGTYRFVGFGDDDLIIAVNQKVVLISCWSDLAGYPESTPIAAPLRAGLWIDCKAGEPIDLDILSCDNGCPEGLCAAFLLIEEKGKTYQMHNGQPILPIFQLAPYDTPDLLPAQYKVIFSHTPALWKGLQ